MAPGTVPGSLRLGVVFENGMAMIARDSSRVRTTDVRMWNTIVKAAALVAQGGIRCIELHLSGPADPQFGAWMAENASGVTLHEQCGNSFYWADLPMLGPSPRVNGDISRCAFPLEGVGGPMLASQAVGIVLPTVMREDPAARLVGIMTPDADVDAGGRSHCWEVAFELPSRGIALRLYVMSDPARETVMQGVTPSILVEERGPLNPVSRPQLPTTFQDSPVAVARFIEEGADFVTGDVLTYLAARMEGDAPLWVLETPDKTYTTPFVGWY